MDLRRLRSFVAVADHGTVSKAAEVLHITQPALSRQIGAFEQDVGFELFERSGRKLALTPRAEQLLSEFRSLLEHVNAVSEKAQALRHGEIRSLRIAASAMTIEGTFPNFMPRFVERFAGAQLTLIEADASEHLDMLALGQVHLAINVVNAVEVDDNRFGCFLLPRFYIHAIYAPAFAFPASDAIEIRKMTDYPLLLPNTTYATRNLFDAACRVAGLRPNIRVESGSPSTLLALANGGHGIAILPSMLLPGPHLRAARVTHQGELLQIAPAVLWDKQRMLPRYAEGFSELLGEHLRAEYPDTHLGGRKTGRKKPSRVAALSRTSAGRAPSRR